MDSNINYGKGSIGGYTVASVIFCVGLSILSMTWALFGGANKSSPIIVATVFGTLGLLLSLLSV